MQIEFVDSHQSGRGNQIQNGEIRKTLPTFLWEKAQLYDNNCVRVYPSSDDGTPEFSGVGVWTPYRVPKQELESQELIPFRNQFLQRVDSF